MDLASLPAEEMTGSKVHSDLRLSRYKQTLQGPSVPSLAISCPLTITFASGIVISVAMSDRILIRDLLFLNMRGCPGLIGIADYYMFMRFEIPPQIPALCGLHFHSPSLQRPLFPAICA